MGMSVGLREKEPNAKKLNKQQLSGDIDDIGCVLMPFVLLFVVTAWALIIFGVGVISFVILRLSGIC